MTSDKQSKQLIRILSRSYAPMQSAGYRFIMRGWAKVSIKNILKDRGFKEGAFLLSYPSLGYSTFELSQKCWDLIDQRGEK